MIHRPSPRVTILGAGAVGLPLAAYLAKQGREVQVARTRAEIDPEPSLAVAVSEAGQKRISAQIPSGSLATLPSLDGIVVVAVKSYVNAAIAAALQRKAFTGPIVILQNGLGVEQPFVAAGFTSIFRGVLYMTSQLAASSPAGIEVDFRAIASSPIGVVLGSEADLTACVQALSTPAFPFHAETEIQRAAWKKTIINAVFNSLCTLLEIDNGIFARDPAAAQLAREVVHECLAVATRRGIALTEAEVLEQIMKISRGSGGVLISTLQDVRAGRPTEIDSLNLEIARLASALNPPASVPKTELLGRLVLQKSLRRGGPARSSEECAASLAPGDTPT